MLLSEAIRRFDVTEPVLTVRIYSSGVMRLPPAMSAVKKVHVSWESKRLFIRPCKDGELGLRVLRYGAMVSPWVSAQRLMRQMGKDFTGEYPAHYEGDVLVVSLYNGS